jgi:5-amino-6-(5-phospho-D-ribitylamino)uracil phosphatase
MASPLYRMIAIDLDGTLLSPAGKVTDRAKAAVHRALQAGLLVCFATGRNWTESRTVLDAVAHYDSAVFVGGAMVIDTGKQATLHRTLMDPQLARELCALLEGAGHAVLALQDTQAAGLDYLVSAELPMNPETQHWMRVTNAVVHQVPRLAEHSHEHTIRIGIVAPRDHVAEVQRQLEQRFAERIFAQVLSVPAAKVDVLEIFDPSVNKWEGIMHVARHHGIAPEQIVAIGDDLNDLAMIKNAGLGVAMGNARPQVKAVAKRVIATNHEEGLAQFLEELVEQHLVEPIDDTVANSDAAA